MPKKLVLIHTVSSLIEMFTGLSREIIPAGVEVVHIADEVLLKDLLRHERITPFINHHFSHHVVEAEQFGADVVLLTCSSIAPCVDVAQPMVNIPVLRIDEAMVDKAISMGTNIGVIATVSTALKPLTELVYARAGLASKKVKVDPVLCDREAYDAMLVGDMETHDRIVRDTLKELMSRNEVVLLAQGSMSRLADTIPLEEKVVPILSSPRLALERVHDLLKDQPPGPPAGDEAMNDFQSFAPAASGLS